MLNLLGIICIILAILCAIYCIVSNPQKTWNIVSAKLVSLFCGLSLVILLYQFLVIYDDNLYVNTHSNFLLPWYYRMAALWSGHEGSMLLWTFFLSFWLFLFSSYSSKLSKKIVSKTIQIQSLIILLFLLFILVIDNPFLSIAYPLQGKTMGVLNPLLQDVGLMIHPPILYIGYVGFSIPFSMSIALLWAGKFGKAEARYLRILTLLSWSLLTLGITLGSWWAYRELGWGGFWFWDPVENVSLMPWLLATALIHTLMMTARQGVFKVWSILLIQMTFMLCLLGAFIVRSGLLVSIHAFSVSPLQGIVLLCILFSICTLGFVLFILRAEKLMASVKLYWFSKDAMLMLNNLLLVIFTLTTLVGTLYPVFLEFITGLKISVGPPYFNLFFLILGLPFLLIMGIGVLLCWGHTNLKQWMKASFPILVLLFITLLGTILSLDFSLKPVPLVTSMLAFWVILSSIKASRFKHWGMMIAHLGLGIMLLGVVISSYYGDEQTLRMHLNDKINFQGYEITYKNNQFVNHQNYRAIKANFEIKKDKQHFNVYPEKRYYIDSGQLMTDADIHATFIRDIYITLGQNLDENHWEIRLYYKPLIRWIWLGGVLMCLGGLTAIIRIIWGHGRYETN